MAFPFLSRKKPTVAKMNTGVVQGAGMNLLGNTSAKKYSVVANPVKTRSGIVDAADTQPISYSSTMKKAAQELARSGNPIEKAAANYYLFMDDPTKKGSAKYYENILRKAGIDINAKSNTGNPVGDFALDVVKGFVGSPAQTGRALAGGGLGAVLLPKEKNKKSVIKSGVKNTVDSTIQTAVESPGQLVGGVLAGVAGAKGVGAISKAGTKTTKTAAKTTAAKTTGQKQTKPSGRNEGVTRSAEYKILDAKSDFELSLVVPKKSIKKGSGKRSAQLITSRNTPRLSEGKSGGGNSLLVLPTSQAPRFTRKSQKKTGTRTTKTAAKTEKKTTPKTKQQNTQVPKFRRKSQTSAYKKEVENFILTLSDEDKYFLNNRAQMKIVDTPESAKKALTIRRKSLKNAEHARQMDAKKGISSVSILKSNREAHKKFVAGLSKADLEFLQNRAKSGVIDGTIKEAEAALKRRHDTIRKHEYAQELDAKKGISSVSILKSNREAHKKYLAKLSADDLYYLNNRAKNGIIDGTIREAEAALKERRLGVKKHKTQKSQSTALVLPNQMKIIKDSNNAQKKTGTAKSSRVEVDAGNGMKYILKIDSATKPKSQQLAKPKQAARTKRGTSRAKRVTALKSGSATSKNTQLRSRQKQTAAVTIKEKADVKKSLDPKRTSGNAAYLALAVVPAISNSSNRRSSVSAKPAQRGKLSLSHEQKPQTKPKTDTSSKKDSEQDKKRTQAQKRSSRTRLRKAVQPRQKSRQTTKSKQIARTSPKAKTKTKTRIRLKEEEKKKKKRVSVGKKQKGTRYETVNQFGWLGIDKKPAAKPRRV